MNLSELSRSQIACLPVYQPGKPAELVARESGLRADQVVKLASNENPYGPSPLALTALQNPLNLARYPDNSGHLLVQALAADFAVLPEQITLGAGSNELFYLLCDVFAGPGVEVVVGEFAFVSYKIAALLAGATVVSVPMPRLQHDLNAMLGAITDRTRLVFLPNPNNPTGTSLPVAEVEAFVRRLPAQVIVCYDAAYAEYSEQVLDCPALIAEGFPIIEARTFSKIHGLAGLRIGYAISSVELAGLLNRVRPPFNTASISQHAALAALQDRDWIELARQRNAAGREVLLAGLQQCGADAFGEHGNFILVRVDNASQVAALLQQNGVVVRPLDAYALPQLIRISIGTHQENQRFLEVWTDLMQGGISRLVPSK